MGWLKLVSGEWKTIEKPTKVGVEVYESNDSGNRCYYLNYPFLHREDGPAVYNNIANHKEWWIHGKLHREDGPAIEFKTGEVAYYQHGNFHRLDGPAIIYSNGIKRWYLNGQYADVSSQEEFERWLKLKSFM